MNILYLIGNGFDKAQGMATSYPEFYADLSSNYNPKNTWKEGIISSINNNLEQWSDLEKALGEETSHYKDSDSFRRALRFLNVRLKDYLQSEESRAQEKITLSQIKLVDDILNPGKYLEEQGTDIFNRCINLDSSTVKIDVVTFNYTNTFERVLSSIATDHHIPSTGTRAFYFGEILHVHGTLDDMILVGVNDEGQIKNESFRTDEYLRDDFIKPEINEGCQNRRNIKFLQFINAANIIVLFGLSVGITDNKWWKAIGERLDSNRPPLLLYYPYDPKMDTIAFPNYKRRWANHYIEFIKERMQINNSMDILSKCICVGINKSFLNLVEG